MFDYSIFEIIETRYYTVKEELAFYSNNTVEIQRKRIKEQFDILTEQGFNPSYLKGTKDAFVYEKNGDTVYLVLSRMYKNSFCLTPALVKIFEKIGKNYDFLKFTSNANFAY